MAKALKARTPTFSGAQAVDRGTRGATPKKSLNVRPGPLATLPAGIHEVAITAFKRDPKLQARMGGMDDLLVNRYTTAIKAGASFPPITLARVDDEVLLVSGWHRTAASERAGLATIQAEIVDCKSNDLEWLASSSNLDHGKPASKADKVFAFNSFIKARRHIQQGPRGRYLTYAEMAKDLHGIASPTTIWNWMKKHHPKIAVKIGKGGIDNSRPDTSRDEEAGSYRAAMAAVSAIAAQMRAVTSLERRMEVCEAVAALGKDLWDSTGDELDRPL